MDLTLSYNASPYTTSRSDMGNTASSNTDGNSAPWEGQHGPLPKFDLSRPPSMVGQANGGSNGGHPGQRHGITREDIARIQPRNEAEAKVKRLLSNPTVFSLMAGADKNDNHGQDVITAKDLKATAAQAGKQNVIEYDDVVNLFAKRLQDQSQGGMGHSHNHSSQGNHVPVYNPMTGQSNVIELQPGQSVNVPINGNVNNLNINL
jgi:hypothetical protein